MFESFPMPAWNHSYTKLVDLVECTRMHRINIQWYSLKENKIQKEWKYERSKTKYTQNWSINRSNRNIMYFTAICCVLSSVLDYHYYYYVNDNSINDDVQQFWRQLVRVNKHFITLPVNWCSDHGYLGDFIRWYTFFFF